MNKIEVTLLATADTPELLTRTVEAVARALAGLALEGIEPMMFVTAKGDDE
ncbi:hypothetical protein [Frigoribacterium sp. VKM Ac-2530]|uniref:hypothetical protein n=1 Tax=Frigoribacterium sp. VKM Ac-2530 TaxID=2783822 RepID=UPI00188B8412|nr:hypothetical protein [Frigoribacterium sp. VKM Ac-2530]MBF4578936.1 hypothetical protein [Frigoribacterium sp. VKM Ac-2530]